jgi:hypothetical protein
MGVTQKQHGVRSVPPTPAPAISRFGKYNTLRCRIGRVLFPDALVNFARLYGSEQRPQPMCSAPISGVPGDDRMTTLNKVMLPQRRSGHSERLSLCAPGVSAVRFCSGVNDRIGCNGNRLGTHSAHDATERSTVLDGQRFRTAFFQKPVSCRIFIDQSINA